MINNTCVYGQAPSTHSRVVATYLNYSFEVIKEKEYTCKDGSYQFHLGDTDMLTLAVSATNGDSLVLQSFDENDVLEHSSTYVIENLGCINRYDLDAGVGVDESADEAGMVDTSTNLEAQVLKFIEEDSSVLYSYFKIELEGLIVSEGNGADIRYVPVLNGEYVVTQKAVNSTTGVITEKITTVTVLGANTDVDSIDYVYYGKKGKVLQIELASYITGSLILADGWYYEQGKLLGKVTKLAPTEMNYARGKVIVKSQVGDIADY